MIYAVGPNNYMYKRESLIWMEKLQHRYPMFHWIPVLSWLQFGQLVSKTIQILFPITNHISSSVITFYWVFHWDIPLVLLFIMGKYTFYYTAAAYLYKIYYSALVITPCLIGRHTMMIFTVFCLWAGNIVGVNATKTASDVTFYGFSCICILSVY